MSEEKKTTEVNEATEVNKTPETPAQSALDAAKKVASGKLKLVKPIVDGEKSYDELTFDFNALTGWELAKALTEDNGRNKNPTQISEMQAMALFAAAAGKCTEGLDAIDVRERMSAADAVTAISVATLFFRGSLLAGSTRIMRE